MDSFVFDWGMILLLLTIMFFGIPFMTYFILEKLGWSKLSKILGLGIFSVFLLCAMYAIFQDYFFFKFSARDELKEMELVLGDDFDILKNESGGFRDYYHTFELKISKSDLTRLVGVRKFDSTNIRVRRKDLGLSEWKELWINPKTNTLIYEYVIN